ncbi:MAG: glycosyl hydrolase, partial [Methanoculleus sp.]|nr:glycosyl hydrolase [Methanoculleus sp.]
MISRSKTTLLLILLTVLLTVTAAAGAPTIQEDPVYTGTTLPGSSPQPAGSGALCSTATALLEAPYKTNSWLSPILWADNQAEIYIGGGLDTATPSTLYQRPVYPLPWSLWYNQDPYTNWDDIYAPLPAPTGTTGLFVRQAAITVHQDARLFSPDGKPDTSTLFMSAIDCIHAKEGIRVDPGFNASHIRVNRMGDYDAELLLLASDDANRPAPIPQNASLRVLSARGSPFIHFAATGIPQANLTLWSASTLNYTTGSLPVKGQNVNYALLTGSMPITPPLDKPEATSTNQTYILFFPAGQATCNQTETGSTTELNLAFAVPAEENFFVLATVPDAAFTDEATLAVLAEAAFCYPSATTVTYQYDAATSSVSATYALEFADVLGLGNPKPVQGLLPIHYGDFFGRGSVLEGTPAWLENSAGSTMAFETVKGTVKYLRQPSFTCRYHYPGILPSMPPLDTHDTTGVDNLTRWIDVFKTANEPQKPAYTAFNDGRGTDTYTGAKALGRNARFALAAEGVGNTTLADAVASSTKSGGIELFFRENPTNTQVETSTGVAPYYALYNASIGTLLIYPASPVNTYFPSDTPTKPYDGYGTVTRLNDHHYTYGYIVNAAALLAMENETWMNEYQEAINQIVFDVAYTKEIPNAYAFPEMRYWDAYLGHCAAGGMTSPDFLTGNNDESISEEINFWAGAILWGTASNQPEITRMGIEHYTVAVYANWAYWQDHFGTYQRLFDAVEGPGYDPRWVSTQYTAQVYDAQVKQSTFFGPHPTDISYITVAPITPASFYHAMDPAAIRTYQQKYEAYLKQYNLDPLNPEGTERFGNNETANQWYGQLAYYSELACWYAMAEPDAALTAYFDVA